MSATETRAANPLAKVGKIVMFYDLDAELWFKCKVIGETENYIQIWYYGWKDDYEKPWVDKDTDRVEPMKGKKGMWKSDRHIKGGWIRVTNGNVPESVKKYQEMQDQACDDAAQN